MKKVLLVFPLILYTLGLIAQVQEEYIDNFYIRTVLLNNSRQEQSFPAIELNTEEKLILQFDNLSDEYSNYTYTIEHCNADWTLSNIPPNDYFEGFGNNYINNYRFSSNTLQPYVHYELEIPNQDLSLKISGNYVLKVFSTADNKVPVLVKRFVVYEQLLGINPQLRRSTVVNDRNKKQKIDFEIVNGDFRIDNPFDQLKVLVMQNDNWKATFMNTRPTYFDNSSLRYDHVDANVFDGLNEYRRFDMRSTRFLGERLAKIERGDASLDIYVVEDRPKNVLRYTEEQDLNGNFYIARSDMGIGNINGDYANVHFTFYYGTQNPFGDYYVLGKFNNWKSSEQSKLTYNLRSGRYENTFYLKQGIYDYMIAFKAEKAEHIDYGVIEGTFFDTENNYRIITYYRRTGSRYDEVIGYKEWNVNP